VTRQPQSPSATHLLVFATFAALMAVLPFIVLARDVRASQARGTGLSGEWNAHFRVAQAPFEPLPASFHTTLELRIDSAALFNPVRGSIADDFVGWLFNGGVRFQSVSYYYEPGIEHPTRYLRGDASGPDSLRLELNPFMSHGSVVVRAAQQGDTITGKWFMITDGHPVRGELVWVRR
jgi:hypothetical protein